MGTIELLPTACGVLLWELYSQGLAIGASLRGWSSVLMDKSLKHSIVQNDFKLVTWVQVLPLHMLLKWSEVKGIPLQI